MAEAARDRRTSTSSALHWCGTESTTQKVPRVNPSVVVSGIPAYAITPISDTEGLSLTSGSCRVSETMSGSPDATACLHNEYLRGSCRNDFNGSPTPTQLLMKEPSPSTSDTKAPGTRRPVAASPRRPPKPSSG